MTGFSLTVGSWSACEFSFDFTFDVFDLQNNNKTKDYIIVLSCTQMILSQLDLW